MGALAVRDAADAIWTGAGLALMFVLGAAIGALLVYRAQLLARILAGRDARRASRRFNRS